MTSNFLVHQVFPHLSLMILVRVYTRDIITENFLGGSEISQSSRKYTEPYIHAYLVKSFTIKDQQLQLYK